MANDLEYPIDGVPTLKYSYFDLIAATWYQRYRTKLDTKKQFMEHMEAMAQGIEALERRKKERGELNGI